MTSNPVALRLLLTCIVTLSFVTTTTTVWAQDETTEDVSASVETEEEDKFTDEDMQAALGDYFEGEKLSAYGFIGLGAVSTVTGAVLVFSDGSGARGAGVTALSLGGLITIASIVYLTSIDGQRGALEQQLGDNSDMYADDERDRVEGVITRFGWFKVAQIAIMFTGVGAAIVGESNNSNTAIGVGATAASISLVSVVMDEIAKSRAEVYLENINKFDPAEEDSALRGESTGTTPLAGLRLRF